MREPVVVGIDVTRETVEACWAERDYAFPNDEGGHRALVAALAGETVELIAMEAAGRYEAACACALRAAGYAVAMVSPRQVRDFASPLGRLARGDRIEARLLERCAALLAARPESSRLLRTVPDGELEALRALVARRREIAEMLSTERGRLAASHRAARPSIEAVLRALRAQLEPLDKQLSRHLPSVPPYWLGGGPRGRRAATRALPPPRPGK